MMLSSVRSVNRASTTSNISPVSQKLSLEQIAFECQEYAHSPELKQILGVSLGNSFEGHCIGVSESKPIPPSLFENLKMFKNSMQDTLGSARDRVIFWQKSIYKLDKFVETARSRKRQRTDHLSNERFGHRNILKMGESDICSPHGNPPQKLEDKTKSSGLEMKKRLCTSMLNTWMDGGSADIMSQQIIGEKCRDMVKVGEDIHIEEKIGTLPVGGGGWERKRKRKRSFRSAGNRLVSVEKNSKQAVHGKLSAESMLQPLPSHSFVSRASSRMVRIHNSVKSSLITHLGSSTESKFENEDAPQLRDSSTIAEIASEGKNKADGSVNRVVNHNTVTGQSVDDHEELLVAANSARNASYRACSTLFWKIMECYFAPVSPQYESYVKNQLDFADALSGSLCRMPGNEYSYQDNLKLQQYPMFSDGRQESLNDQGSIDTAALAGSSSITETLDEAPSLYGRVLSALIEEDKSKEMSLQDYKKHDFQCGSDDSHRGSCNDNGIEAENKNRMTTNNITCKLNGRNLEREVDLQVWKQGFFGKNSYDNGVSSNTDSNQSICSSECNTEHWQTDDGLSDYAGLVPWISHSDLGSSMESNTSPVSSLTSNYHMLSVKDKLRLELQNVDLFPEMHHIEEGQYDQEIFRLQAELNQKVQKRKKYLVKIYEAIQHEKEAEKRNLEQAALSKLTEMAYKNQMVSCGGALRKFSKKVALPFAERTLARWRKFEDTGRSCFDEADLQNVLFSTPTFNSNPDTVDKDANRLSYHNWQPRSSGSLAKQHLGTDPEVLLNDVDNASSKAIIVGNVKGKRSERANDDSENYIPKKFVRHIGRPPEGSSIDVRPSTLKPKVKALYLVASNDGSGSKYMESMGVVSEDMRIEKEQSNVKKEKNRVNPSAAELTEFGSSKNQDFNTLLDIELERMKDEVMEGLDVPMDDLKDVHLFI